MNNTETNNLIRYIILTGLWAILFIPFFVANSMFFPFIAGKNFAFRIIVEIIFALWVYLAFADAKFRPKFSWVLGAVGLFVAVMFVADIFAVAPMKAFWSNFERMDGWITLIHLLMYLSVFGSVMKTEKIWLWFFRSSLAISVIMFVMSLSEWLSGANRVSVKLGNPIYVAVYFLFNFFFALILLYKDVIVNKISDKKVVAIFTNWLTYVYLIGAFLSGFGIWMTATRGVILGLLGGLFVTAIIIAIFERENKLMRSTAIGGLVAILVLVAVFFAIKDTQFVKNNPVLSRFAVLSWNDIKGQGQARQYVWGMAIKGAQEKPILGWGQDGFNYVFNKYYDPRMYGQEQWFDRAHNMPLDMLIAGGIFGLLSYLGIFVAALWLIWKKRNVLGITDAGLLVGLLAGYFFQNLFVFDNLTSYVFFFVVLAYIHSRSTEDEAKELNKKDKVIDEDIINYTVVPILVVIFGISFWFLNVRPISANLDLIQAMSGQKEGITKNLEYFKKAISYNTFANPEIREQLVNIMPNINSLEIDAKFKKDFAEFAYSQIDTQTVQTPLDARYQLFAGMFLNGLGQYELALPYLQKAVELSPNKQTIMFELIKSYTYLGKKKEAFDLAKKAYDLAPEFESAKSNYIAAALISDNNKVVRELLGDSTTTSDVIVRAYVVKASDYLQKGDKYSAVAEIQKAIKVAPGFKEQGDKIIKGIWDGTVK